MLILLLLQLFDDLFNDFCRSIFLRDTDGNLLELLLLEPPCEPVAGGFDGSKW
jgi:hypothetical protein